jgi:hypothetical protein
MKIPFFKGNKIKHNDINIIKANNGKSIEKFSRTSEYYYNIQIIIKMKYLKIIL